MKCFNLSIFVFVCLFLLSCGTEQSFDNSTVSKKLNNYQQQNTPSNNQYPNFQNSWVVKYNNDDAYFDNSTKNSKSQNNQTKTQQQEHKTNNASSLGSGKPQLIKPSVNIPSLPAGSKPLSGAGGFAPKPLGPDMIY